VRTLDYLTDTMYLPGVATALAVAIMGAVLSPLVVLKRMSFVGQGISHAAFGGVGVAAILGLARLGVDSGAAEFLVVAAFCVAAALLVAALIQRGAGEADTAIGIVLVGSMALGAILVQLAYARFRTGIRPWESILFGSVMNVGPSDAAAASLVTLAVIAALWWVRRPMLFWAFDEPVAPAFGVPAGALRTTLVVLLALAIVTATKLAGVVLATAVLVLPGAIALRLTDRLGACLGLSVAAALAGLLGGLVLSFEANLPPGPSIVVVFVGLYAGARLAGSLVPRAAR